jgi:hypothetical protein
MHSSFTCVFLTILLSNLSWLVLAGDYPLIGVTLLQSAPNAQAFGSVTLTQQYEGSLSNEIYSLIFLFGIFFLKAHQL